MKNLKLDLKKASKYILKIEGLDLFLSNQQGLRGCNLTENVNDALEYSIGFDDKDVKCNIWNATIRLMTNNKNVTFKAICK